MKPKPQAHTQAKPLRRLKAENILRDRYFHGLSDQAWRRIRAQPGFPRRFKTGPASNSPALIDEDELAAFQRLFIERKRLLQTPLLMLVLRQRLKAGRIFRMLPVNSRCQ